MVRAVGLVVRVSGEIDVVFADGGRGVGGLIHAFERAVDADRLSFYPSAAVAGPLVAGGYGVVCGTATTTEPNRFASGLLAQNATIHGDAIIFKDLYRGTDRFDLNTLAVALRSVAPGIAGHLSI